MVSSIQAIQKIPQFPITTVVTPCAEEAGAPRRLPAIVAVDVDKAERHDRAMRIDLAPPRAEIWLDRRDQAVYDPTTSPPRMTRSNSTTLVAPFCRWVRMSRSLRPLPTLYCVGVEGRPLRDCGTIDVLPKDCTGHDPDSTV